VITASYAGDSRFAPDTDTEIHRVNPLPQVNNPPTANFTPPSCTMGQPCQFNDESTDNDGSVEKWSWNFGPGGASIQEDPSATFPAAGTFDVTLTVTDDDGAANSVTKQVTVNAPNNPPQAGFDPPVGCTAGSPCPFSDASSDDGTLVQWDWTINPGGATETGANMSHTFATAGTYFVTLRVTDDMGLTDDVTNPVDILP
jgi:PKD repeat protein